MTIVKQRINVHLYVIPTCNLQCIHCYYDAKDTTFKLDNLISVNEMEFVITFLIDNYDAYFDIEGGELFLRKDINELFSSLADKYLSRLTITTNGTVKFDFSQQYLKKLDEVRLSFEGHTDKLQHEIRGINLDKPINTALKLAGNNVSVVMRITIHKGNYLSIIEMIDYFSRKGLCKFSMYEYQPSGRGKSHDKYCLNESEMIDVITALNSISSDVLIKFSFPRSRINIVKKYSTYQALDVSNVSSLTINYNGSLGVCPWEVNSDTKGFFKESTFKETIVEFMRNNELIHNCDHCSYIRIVNRA